MNRGARGMGFERVSRAEKLLISNLSIAIVYFCSVRYGIVLNVTIVV